MSDETRLEIHPDIAQAETLPGEFYRDPAWFQRCVDRALLRSWHFVGDDFMLPAPGSVAPTRLLGGPLAEPLVLTRDLEGEVRCLSNVCTHRANLVAIEAGERRDLRCGYHGRRFQLDGRFVSSPEFEGCRNFPCGRDDLTGVQLRRLGPFLFASLEPAVDFDEMAAPVLARLEGLPLDRLQPDPGGSVDYPLDVHFALYCDNYLEGLHVPWVHPGLARVLDFRAYRTEAHPWAVTQLGLASDAADALELPEAHPDHGDPVAGLYFWMFPATMVNVYPWGISINSVIPEGPARSTIRYRRYIWDASRLGTGAGGALDEVEMEDQEIVLRAQAGVRARLYRSGRFSPGHEVGVHAFHRMMAALLS